MPDYNFIQDPRWPDLDSDTKTKVLDNIFEARYAQDVQGFDQTERSTARDLFLKQASDVEEALYPDPERTVGGTIKDIGIALGTGVIGAGEAAVGLADIPTGGRVGKWMEDKLGYDPGQAKDILADFYSEPQKAAREEVAGAEGFFGKAGAMLRSPSTIAETALESAPSMLVGGAAGRGLLAVAPKLAPFLAAAAGEGIVGAGSAAEQVRQQTEDGLLTAKQAAIPVLSGAGTALFGAAGGRLAKKFGFGDVDSMLVSGSANVNQKGIAKRIIGGGISEGMFEELPQSMQEQVWQNAALDKPLMEGVKEAGATGLLTGAAMGGGANIFAAGHQEDIGKAETIDEATTAFTKSVTAPTPTIGQEADQLESFLETVGLPTAEETQWEADITEQRRKFAAERQKMADRQAAAEAPPEPATPEQLAREARQMEIEGVVSPGVPVTEGQTKVDRDIEEFRRVRQQEKEVAYLEQALKNKEVPQQEVTEAQQELDRLTTEFESRVGRDRVEEIPILERGEPIDEELVRPAPPTRLERLRERLGGEVAPPLGLKGEPGPVEFGEKITERKVPETAIVEDQEVFDVMQQQVQESQTKGTSYTPEGEKVWYGASSPMWMQNIQAKAKSSGQKVFSRSEINTLLDKARGNIALTEKQSARFELLKEASNEVKTTDEAFAGAYEAEEMEREGFTPMGGQDIPAADLSQGDIVRGTVDGVSADWNVSISNEAVTFSDPVSGTEKTVDLFDTVKVEGVKKASEKQPPKKKAEPRQKFAQDKAATGDITSKSGKPFKTESSAKLAISRDRKVSTHEAVDIEGGWVGREKGVDFSVVEEPKTAKEISTSWKQQGIENFVIEKDDKIKLEKIVAPVKGEGIGSKAINELAEYADNSGKTITLTPSKDFGATSIPRLVKFYKAHGFVENKGKNKDYEISDSMYRLPKGVKLSVTEKEQQDALRKPRRDQADIGGREQAEFERLLAPIGKEKGGRVVSPRNEKETSIAKVGDEFGLNVTFFESVNNDLDLVNGFTSPDGNTLYVNVDGPNPALGVVGHETLHKLRTKHEGLYDFLVDNMKGNIKDFDAYFDNYTKARERAIGGKPLSKDKVLEEFIANTAMDQFQDPKFWEKMHDKNPSFTKRIIDFIQGIISKLTGKSYVKKHIKDLQKAQDAMAQAMGEFAARAKAKPKAEPKAKPKLSVREGPASIESPAFKKWFGDSVVTESGKAGGEPLVVYHGTPVDDITNFAFDPSRIGEQGRSEGAGFYFTPEKRIAKGYAGDKGTVLNVYLNIKKPIPYEMEGFEADTLKDILLEVAEIESEEMGMDIGDGFLSNYGDVGFEGLGTVLDSAAEMMAYEDTALDQIGGIVGSGVEADTVNQAVMNVTGYDGVTSKGFFNEGKIPIYVAFFPNQVKSTDNLGTWSKDDPRIQMSVAESPVLFAETKGKVTDQDIKDMLAEKRNIKMAASTNLARFWSSVKRGTDKYLGAISTRLGKISEKLKNKMRELDYNIGTNFAKDTLNVKPLLDKAKKNMTSDDFKIWDYARKNSDVDRINELIKKYDLKKEYDAYRKTVDKIRDEAIDVGLEVGKIEEYAPRVLKDTEGFLKAMGKDPEFPIITRRVQERARELGISYSELTDDQRADLISNMLLGGGGGLAGPSFAKERKIEKIPAKLNRYYMDSDAALMQYLYSMRKGIEARKFFGKVPDKVKKAKTRLNDALKRIRELDPVKDKKKINDLKSNAYAYRNILDMYKIQRDYTENIGSYIDDLIIKKEIKPGDESVVRDIMMARFHEKGTSGLTMGYKNLSYIDTMGSPMSALTQIGDLGWAMYEGGFIPALKHAYRSVRGKSRISRDDLGVTHMAQEFADSDTLGKAVNKVFQLTGLEKMDAIGKETLVNASLDKYEKMARKQPGKLKMKIQKIFGSDTDGVIDDLKNGDITENVKLLVFHRLLDFQPVTLSEMPQKYLDAGNGRLFYMLKTFTIKQFDVFRNEAFGKIKNGDRAEKIEGMKNLAKLSMFLVLANAGADELKDLMSGRKTDLSDRVVDNVLRLGGISKFVTWQARTEGVGTALAKQILPPFKFANSLSKDIVSAGDGKGLETVSSIPILGKLAYWHMGRGTSKRMDLWDRRFNKRKKKMEDFNEKLEKAKNKQEFRSNNRKQLVEMARTKSMKSKLSKNRRQINILKSREDSKGNRKLIQGLEARRVNMIKDFLK